MTTATQTIRNLPDEATLKEWAELRADDAGRLARAFIAMRKQAVAADKLIEAMHHEHNLAGHDFAERLAAERAVTKAVDAYRKSRVPA